MSAYFPTKFQVSSIILTSFRQEGVIPLPLKKTGNPKTPTQIRVKRGDGWRYEWVNLFLRHIESKLKVNKITMSSVFPLYGSIYLNVKFKR